MSAGAVTEDVQLRKVHVWQGNVFWCAVGLI